MINASQLERIKEFALDLDWNRAFGGKSKGNKHLFRVVSLVKKILEEEEFLQEVDPSIIEAGAWLHDSGLAKDIAGDALCNIEEVTSFLKSIDINEKDISLIRHCIEAHDGHSSALSIEAKIVHDADTLDKMGPLGIIRETWKRSQMGWTSEKIASHLKAHLERRKNLLHTEIAKMMAEELNSDLIPFFSVLERQIGE
ncbi:MAG: HD domain-containing protein [Candidatus Woesearchaeota archaeon]|jgi:HD superfamily phosphodiesterase